MTMFGINNCFLLAVCLFGTIKKLCQNPNLNFDTAKSKKFNLWNS